MAELRCAPSLVSSASLLNSQVFWLSCVGVHSYILVVLELVQRGHIP